MSSNAQAWARQQKHPSLKSADLLLLRELAEWADPTGKIKNDEDEGIFFDYKILADLCSVSIRTIPRMLNKLEKLSLIKRKPRFDEKNGHKIASDYQLIIPENYVIKIENRNHAISSMRTTLNNKDLQKNTTANPIFDETCQNDMSDMTKWRDNIKRSIKGNKDIIKYIPSSSKNELKGVLVDEQFSEFWKLYPKKSNNTFPANEGSKKVALVQFKKALKLFSFEKLMEALKAQIAEREYRHQLGLFNPQFRHASTWLNQEAWEDSISSKEDMDNEQQRSKQAGLGSGNQNIDLHYYDI